jgi:putative transposase
MSNFEFAKHFNHDIKPMIPWMSGISSKALMDLITNCWNTIKRTHKLNFKSKKRKPVSSYAFAKSAVHYISPNKITVPILKEIKIKEFGYITQEDISHVSGGRIIYNRSIDRWYVMLRLRYEKHHTVYQPETPGIGIDLGIKSYIVVSFHNAPSQDGEILFNGYSNPIRDPISESGYAKINHYNQIIDHKVICNMIRLGYDPKQNRKKIKKEDIDTIYHSNAINKLRMRIAKIEFHIRNHKYDAYKKACNILTRIKPEYICMESIDASALVEKRKSKSKSLRRYNSRNCYYYFRTFMAWKCDEYNIPFYLADDFYPSTQRCSDCGCIKDGKSKLKINQRVYKCKECGAVIDRDINAARNIMQWGNNQLSREIQRGQRRVCYTPRFLETFS